MKYALTCLVLMLASAAHAQVPQPTPRAVDQGWVGRTGIAPAALQDELRKLNALGCYVSDHQIRLRGDVYDLIVSCREEADEEESAEAEPKTSSTAPRRPTGRGTLQRRLALFRQRKGRTLWRPTQPGAGK